MTASSVFAIDDFPMVPLTELQRRWLRIVYERQEAGERTEFHRYRRLNPGAFPADFNPSSIDDRLLGYDHGSITLLGIAHVEPNAEILALADRVIRWTRERIMADPTVRLVFANDVAENLQTTAGQVARVWELLRLLRPLSFVTGVGHGPKGHSIQISGESLFQQYESYSSLPSTIDTWFRLVARERQLAATRQVISDPPPEIAASLDRFEQEHGDSACVFIMMDFAETPQHQQLLTTLRETLADRGMKGLRSDDRTYNDNLLLNVLTYAWACRAGIAVFERIQSDAYNPNVAFEVGYMKALRKRVLLLKDQNLPTLQSDLIGVLYQPFDPQRPSETIPRTIDRWLADL